MENLAIVNRLKNECRKNMSDIKESKDFEYSVEHLVIFNDDRFMQRVAMSESYLMRHCMTSLKTRLDYTDNFLDSEKNDKDVWYGTVYRIPWVLNNQSDKCMRCDSNFGTTKWKHHCRACGFLVCNSCSSNRLLITALTNETAMTNSKSRVCTSCVVEFDIKSSSMKVKAMRNHLRKNKPSGTISRDQVFESCQEKNAVSVHLASSEESKILVKIPTKIAKKQEAVCNDAAVEEKSKMVTEIELEKRENINTDKVEVEATSKITNIDLKQQNHIPNYETREVNLDIQTNINLNQEESFTFSTNEKNKTVAAETPDTSSNDTNTDFIDEKEKPLSLKLFYSPSECGSSDHDDAAKIVEVINTDSSDGAYLEPNSVDDKEGQLVEQIQHSISSDSSFAGTSKNWNEIYTIDKTEYSFKDVEEIDKENRKLLTSHMNISQTSLNNSDLSYVSKSSSPFRDLSDVSPSGMNYEVLKQHMPEKKSPSFTPLRKNAMMNVIWEAESDMSSSVQSTPGQQFDYRSTRFPAT